MREVPLPVSEALRDPVDDAMVERVMRRVDTSRVRAHPGRRAVRRAVVLGVPALAAAAVVLFVLARGRPAVSPPGVTEGPLRLADNSSLAARVGAPRDGQRAIALADGSRVWLDPGTELSVVTNTARAFATDLSHGRARFEVRPGGPRRWSVATGGVVTEVVGTGFTIAYGTERVRVEVDHGVVSVRGARVPGGARRLTAGESVEVTLVDVGTVAATPAAPIVVPPAPARAPATPAPSSAARTVSAGSESPTWRELARRGQYAQAYETLGAPALRAASASTNPDELMELADVARLSGHPAEAVAPLERLVRDHPRDASAPLAAFTLGRLELDTLGHPARAAHAFERAIALGAPRTLLEDALARLVEARARAGDAAGARAAAADYAARFPSGRRAAEVQRWGTAP